MRKDFLNRTRRWIGASALAILIGSGGLAAYITTSQQAAAVQEPVSAHLQQAAQINPPQATAAHGFADLVDAVKPAVVSVLVDAHGPAGDDDSSGGDQFNFSFPDLPDNSPLKRFFEQFGHEFGTPPQHPRRYEAAGSGFAISPDGYFVTNNHVVENADKITVVFDDGTQKTAKIVGTDKRTDLAVLKVDGLTNQPFVKLADNLPRVGDWVMAVGNPFGLGGTVTVGVVSAEGRDISGSNYGDFLQIDAAVNRGNSGGPTFNLNGEVVGVNTAIFSPNGGSVGIAFDIPSTVVKQVTDQLIKSGKVTRGFLGVSIQNVTPDIADSVGLQSPRGALVAEPTSKDSPAAKAGIQSGDIITQVDGKDIKDALDLSRTIANKAPGSEVDLTIFRDGQERHVKVTLSTLPANEENASNDNNQPEQEEPESTKTSVGLTVVPNSSGPGVLVQNVDPNSVAATKGFAVGDTILEVNNKKVSNGREFADALKSVKDNGRDTALIKAERDGQVRFIGLPLDQSGL